MQSQPSRSIRRILVANRGAVAARVIRAAKVLGIQTVAVYSAADAQMPYLQAADAALCIGGASATDSYLNQEAVLSAARESDADALHPGYGFLSENAVFAERVESEGLCFIGPSPRWIKTLGHKTAARELMLAHGMPMTRSSALLPDDLDEVTRIACDMGFPLMLKPANGGGGIGMLPVRAAHEIAVAWRQAQSTSAKAFGTSELYFETLIDMPRHVEFQFLADRHGQVRCLYERDCSMQRRNQKVIEETPAPGIPRDAVQAMARRLEAILADIGYDVIGTVEMLYTPVTGFTFLEVNTRLQVEHAVTEEVTGVDIVAAQIRLAAGEPLSAVLSAPVECRGHAVEARIYAEDPVRFFPSPGELAVFEPPVGEGIRVETGYGSGTRVSSHYDPMLAKVIAHGADRGTAVARLADALERFRFEGVKTNIPYVLRVLRDPAFVAGQLHTQLGAAIASRTL
ncbi:ATP-grasp domain-containing protein [Verminephrobacter eiseniae]|uniref:acetyl-CoA carboxylase biotin carboxylase subunit n=1 Tax=Verminephrobacter eiseniae TaxID=364317 RepID=UPI00223795D0|nr:biotin carboxylase N-terminal domain-containing protein [Verminephrobacter eiseniae]MCW5259268.1 ATP-grasp domain-containing protein [Verminephrobacter eiseniae]